MPWHPCVSSRDTITQDEGVVTNHVDYPDVDHIPLSHCRVADGTWVAWWNIFGGGLNFNDIDTYTGNNFAVSVGYFPDDGSIPIVYDLFITYSWFWDGGGLYSGASPCSIRNEFGTRYFDNATKSELTGWQVNVLDVQIRTDGTNVWVVVLAGESVMYPFLSNTRYVDLCKIGHPSILEVAQGEGLIPGGDGSPFAHDTTFGNRWWQERATFAVPDAPSDDAGPGSSFRWQPARVSVFAGDIGGFSGLGTVEAAYNNLGQQGLCSGIDSAASPSEPGVLHVMWAEGGSWDEHAAQVGQRITYSTWDFTSKLAETDLARAEQSMTDGGYNSADNWVWTGEMIVRNDHGSPAAIVVPLQIDSSDASGVESHSGPPQYWDLSSGAAIVVQEMDSSLYPTTAESGLASPVPTVGSTVGGRRDHFASSLYTDPTLTDTDVYLLCLGFSGGTAKAFYRIPCDGSAAFDYMDGTRLVMYSIIPNGAFETDGTSFFMSDFVSDPGNVWMPSFEDDGGAMMHLIRTCERTWERLPCFPTVSPGGYQTGAWDGLPMSTRPPVLGSTSPPVLVYDDDSGDWIAGGGNGPILTVESSDPSNIAAIRAKICRCCVPCIERIGLHIWEKV